MAHTFVLEAQAIWKILVVGLVLGAGLPALFAVGVRSLAAQRAGTGALRGGGSDDGAVRAHPAAGAVAVLCFAVVLAVVALGIVYIVVTGFGDVLSFEHVYPTITAKP